MTRQSMKSNGKTWGTVALLMAAVGLAGAGFAQTYAPAPAPVYTPVYPTPAAPTYAPPAPVAPPAGIIAVQPQMPQLSDTQVNDLTASVALYPDPLLAIMMPAATYPLEIASANQWLVQHPNPDELTINNLPYQPTVKTLIHYPGLLGMMADHLDWTQALGTAFVNQQPDVMNSIQRWRTTAVADGTLFSTPQQQVVNTGGMVSILPAQQQLVYVPVYDPAVVYVPHRGPARDLIRFDVGGRFGTWLDFDLDWNRRAVLAPEHPYWERHDVDNHSRWDELHRPIVIAPGRDGHLAGPPAGHRVYVRDGFKGIIPDKIVMPSPDHKVVVIGHGGNDHRDGPGARGNDNNRGAGRGNDNNRGDRGQDANNRDR